MHGVPQGSHLDPILFTLFINHFSCVICIRFDDVKTFNSLLDIDEFNYLFDDISIFTNSCRHNLVDLNAKKYKHISFVRHNPIDIFYWNDSTFLNTVKTIVDIGILLDRKLNFNDKIYMILNNVYGVRRSIKHWSKEFLDTYLKKILFLSFL